MRDPNNLIDIDSEINNQPQILKLNGSIEFDYDDYNLDDPKAFRKYIANIEKIVRTSYEYKQFVSFLREYMDMNHCSFLENITNVESFRIKIHLHHEPITLFDIVLAIYNKRLDNRESLSEDMVAKEVMYQHYMLRVGIIPLSETVHELVHNQYIFVPTTAVFGKYWEFVDLYRKYIDPCILETLEKIEEATKTFTMDKANELLSTNLIYLDTSDVYKQTDLEDVKKLLQKRIDDMNTNHQINVL